MTRTRDEVRFVVFCFLTDALLFWLCLNVATLTRLPTLLYFSFWRLQLDRLMCTALFAAGTALVGAYSLARIGDPFDAIYYTWSGLGIAALVELALVSFVPADLRVISRRELLISLGLAAVVLAFWRYYVAGLVSRFPNLRRFFHVYGSEPEARRIVQAICEDENRQAEAEYIKEGEKEKRKRGEKVEEAIVALGNGDQRLLHETLVACEERYRRVFLYPSLHDARRFRHASVHAVAGIPLVELASNTTPAAYLYFKRLMDVAAASAGLLMALPICAVAAMAIKLMSPGDLFYTQTRMGKGHREFKLYKFRTMVSDAEAKTGPVWASANDARITPVGRFLRKHRVDEIPQLLNVLKGDMSLIGPRPERPHFHREFCEQWPLFDKRLMVRPGLTSLSHVLGSYGSNPEDRLRYDLIYIGNMSLLTDLQILVATVRIVLGAKGAQ